MRRIPVIAELTLSVVLACGLLQNVRAGEGATQAPDCNSLERQHPHFERAAALVRHAQSLFDSSNLPEAIRKYRQALGLCVHPTIHLGLAQALVDEGQLLAAYDSLSSALVYSETFTADESEAATKISALLKSQLSFVKLRSSAPGTEIQIDERTVLVGLGDAVVPLLPREHRFRASGPGSPEREQIHTTRPAESLLLAVSRHVVVDEDLIARWPRWKPWSVVGLGVAGGLVGLGLRGLAVRRYRRASDHGWPASGAMRYEDRGAEWLVRSGDVLTVTGAAAVGVGLLMVFLNEPKRVVKEIHEDLSLTLIPELHEQCLKLQLDMKF